MWLVLPMKKLHGQISVLRKGFRFGNSSKNIAIWGPYDSEKDGRTARIRKSLSQVSLDVCSRAIDAFLHSSTNYNEYILSLCSVESVETGYYHGV